MRAAVFVRHHSGDELGHVGWGFDVSLLQANCGSVENHSGHLLSPSQGDGFWTRTTADPVVSMRKQQYDDVKYIDLSEADPVSAYRVLLWIKERGYGAAFRNCEDDAYDVLRAYGVPDLPVPALHWLPNRWFTLLDAPQAPVTAFSWNDGGGPQERPSSAVDLEALTPLQPTWRNPLHSDFHRLHAAKFLGVFRRKR